MNPLEHEENRQTPVEGGSSRPAASGLSSAAIKTAQKSGTSRGWCSFLVGMSPDGQFPSPWANVRLARRVQRRQCGHSVPRPTIGTLEFRHVWSLLSNPTQATDPGVFRDHRRSRLAVSTPVGTPVCSVKHDDPKCAGGQLEAVNAAAPPERGRL